MKRSFHIIPFLAFLLLSFNTFSQHYEEIKDQQIILEDFTGKSLETFMTNIYSFVGQDFDSLDIELMFKQQTIEVLMDNLAKSDDTLTYEHLYEKFREIKKFPSYSDAKEKQIIAKELMQRPADSANWEKDKPAFMALGFEGELLETLRVYLKENANPELSYQIVLIDFREQVEQRRIEAQARKSAEFEKLLKTQGAIDVNKLLQRSKTENKPILLYFTGYNSINSRKMEQYALFKPQVFASIQNDFIFVPFYNDDRTELPKEEKEIVIYNNRNIELQTIGDKNMYYQMSRFKVSTQPYFVVLNTENEILATADYDANTVEAFLNFLNYALSIF